MCVCVCVCVRWAGGGQHAPVADFMSPDRFLKWMSTLRFADNLTVSRREGQRQTIETQTMAGHFSEVLENYFTRGASFCG